MRTLRDTLKSVSDQEFFIDQAESEILAMLPTEEELNIAFRQAPLEQPYPKIVYDLLVRKLTGEK